MDSQGRLREVGGGGGRGGGVRGGVIGISGNRWRAVRVGGGIRGGSCDEYTLGRNGTGWSDPCTSSRGNNGKRGGEKLVVRGGIGR